jgi:hypothetical protein
VPSGSLRRGDRLGRRSLLLLEPGFATTTIGMKAWSAPQSSVHWPRYVPGFSVSTEIHISLMNPGIASRLMPISRTHQAWMTSFDVRRMRTLTPVGMTSGLSTSSR